MIKKVESMEFIIKYRTKEDDRIVIVELTNKGRELKDQVLDIPEKMYCGVEMSKDEIVLLKYYLEKMLKKF